MGSGGERQAAREGSWKTGHAKEGKGKSNWHQTGPWLASSGHRIDWTTWVAVPGSDRKELEGGGAVLRTHRDSSAAALNPEEVQHKRRPGVVHFQPSAAYSGPTPFHAP